MQPSPPGDSGKRRALLVEDHPAVAEVLARLLCVRGGFEVQIAGSAEEALIDLPEQRYELAVIDIHLPGRSGIWLTQHLHQLQPALPLLIVSGLADRTLVDRSVEAGASGYVLKDDVPGILEGVRAVMTGGTYFSKSLRGDDPGSQPDPP